MKRFNVTAKWLDTDKVMNHQSVQENQIDFVNQTFHYNNFYPAQPIQSIENVDTGYLAAFESYCDEFGTAAEQTFNMEEMAFMQEWQEEQKRKVQEELDRMADLMAGEREVDEELDNLADLMDAAIDFQTLFI